MLSVASVDVAPGGFHAIDFGFVFFRKTAAQGVFELVGRGTGKHASNVHVGIASAGETEIDDADHLVVLVEQNVAEIEVAVDKLVRFGVFDESVVVVDVSFVVLIIEFVEEFAERVFDFLRCGFQVDVGKFLDEPRDIVSGASESSVGQMINAVAEGVAVNFFVNRKRTAVFVAEQFHVGGVETGFAFDEVTNSSVFHNHFGPERVAGEAEKVGFLVGGYLNNDVGPTSENVFSIQNFAFGQRIRNDGVEVIVGCEKISHATIIT